VTKTELGLLNASFRDFEFSIPRETRLNQPAPPKTALRSTGLVAISHRSVVIRVVGNLVIDLPSNFPIFGNFSLIRVDQW